MKKLLIIAAVVMLGSCICLYAEDEEHSAEPKPAEQTEKTAGASIGFRLSVLGVEPVVSVILHNVEIEGYVPLISNSGWNADEQTVLGTAFGGSIGYISNPFKRGWENGVGVSYLYLAPSYCQATIFREALKDTTVSENGGQIFSFYYRGTVKFNKTIGLCFKVNLPFIMYFPGNGNYSRYSIIDANRSWICWLIMPCSFAIGMRFEI